MREALHVALWLVGVLVVEPVRSRLARARSAYVERHRREVQAWAESLAAGLAWETAPRGKDGVACEPAPPWNWCPKCRQTVDDDMRAGSWHDGSEGTCAGCGTVYVAVEFNDDTWQLYPRESDEEDEPPSEPAGIPVAPGVLASEWVHHSEPDDLSDGIPNHVKPTACGKSFLLFSGRMPWTDDPARVTCPDCKAALAGDLLVTESDTAARVKVGDVFDRHGAPWEVAEIDAYGVYHMTCGTLDMFVPRLSLLDPAGPWRRVAPPPVVHHVHGCDPGAKGSTSDPFAVTCPRCRSMPWMADPPDSYSAGREGSPEERAAGMRDAETRERHRLGDEHGGVS